MSFISLRHDLTGAVSDFLLDAKWGTDQGVQDGLISIVERLKTYREEGRSLTPEILLFRAEHREVFKGTAVAAEFLAIGQGTDVVECCRTALKRCAPLADNGWYIFIEVGPTVCYGLFRVASSIAVRPEISLIDEGADCAVILVRQVAEHVVELKGLANAHLEVHYSTERETAEPAGAGLKGLIQAIAGGVRAEFRDRAEATLLSAFTRASREGHGFLVAVIPRGGPVPGPFGDAVNIDTCSTLEQRLQKLAAEPTIETYEDLNSFISLAGGMLMTDGITIFDDAGTVRAYNAFLQNPPADIQRVMGGARSRTFTHMSRLVDDGTLLAAFMQSQDGESQFHKRNDA